MKNHLVLSGIKMSRHYGLCDVSVMKKGREGIGGIMVSWLR